MNLQAKATNVHLFNKPILSWNIFTVLHYPMDFSLNSFTLLMSSGHVAEALLFSAKSTVFFHVRVYARVHVFVCTVSKIAHDSLNRF